MCRQSEESRFKMVETCNQRASPMAHQLSLVIIEAVFVGVCNGEEAMVTPTDESLSLKASDP